MPLWQSYRDQFDTIVAQVFGEIVKKYPPAAEVELAVEEVPPSDPPSWEHGAIRLGKTFAKDRRLGLKSRVVLYRQPIVRRCDEKELLAGLIKLVLVENLASLLGVLPDTLDPEIND
ncbi:hypothetical protein BK816_03405 [Boudabousia tangfeifanii]|uniref:Peptidase n=2 Tax=Boudabousia tangfeifanii TaxID=1912795 RepID=A0A1D9MMN1_9ACTO|nr:hypothetical protein BK816_03405 [Boudabousia tangfeifanii]